MTAFTLYLVYAPFKVASLTGNKKLVEYWIRISFMLLYAFNVFTNFHANRPYVWFLTFLFLGVHSIVFFESEDNPPVILKHVPGFIKCIVLFLIFCHMNPEMPPFLEIRKKSIVVVEKYWWGLVSNEYKTKYDKEGVLQYYDGDHWKNYEPWNSGDDLRGYGD